MHFNLTSFKKTFALFSPHQLFKSSQYRSRLYFTLFLVLLDIVASIYIPFASKEIVNSLNHNLVNGIWITFVLLGFFWTMEKILGHLQDIIFFPIINDSIRDLSYKVVAHIHQISLKDYQALSMPEVINCIRRISLSARSFFKILLIILIPSIIKLSLASLIIFKLGVIGLSLLPVFSLIGFILYYGTQSYVSLRNKAWCASDDVTVRVSDSILNTKIIRYFEKFEMNRLYAWLNIENGLWLKTNTRLHIIYVLIGTILGLTLSGILYQTLIAIQRQELTIGDFVFIKGQLITAFLPLKAFSTEFRQLAESMIDIKKIVNILEIPKEKKSLMSAKITTLSTQAVVFNGVSFAYSHQNFFKELSFNILTGEKVAIFGNSSAGKSTLLNLMAGLISPNEGNIIIHQYPLQSLSREALSTLVHYIPQDFRLFNLSLKENLLYGLPHNDEEDLTSVIQLIGLENLIHTLPNGLETMVGEMGMKLSGGEKQRVALARALLMKPQILILDETTNSLNTESEEKILKALFATIPTVIIASHRISTLKHVDRAFKISNHQLLNVDISLALADDLAFTRMETKTELCTPSF